MNNKREQLLMEKILKLEAQRDELLTALYSIAEMRPKTMHGMVSCGKLAISTANRVITKAEEETTE